MRNVKLAISIERGTLGGFPCRQSRQTPRVIAMIGLLLGACLSESQDWQAAESQNEVSGYREFRRKYPQSEHAAEAARRIENLGFERAKELGTVEAWQSLLDEQPKSSRASEAWERLQERAFADATAAKSIQAYQDFLRRYPNAGRAREVSAKLEEVFTPIPRDKVLVIPGVAPFSGNGRAIVRNGDTPGLCELTADGRINSKKENACLDLCYANLELRANTRVPLVWFKGNGPVNKMVSRNFRTRMNVSCGLEDEPGGKPLNDEMGFLVSGPQGAKLKKIKNGFQLVEGQANYLRPGAGLQVRSQKR
jgi:hypothetical protein